MHTAHREEAGDEHLRDRLMRNIESLIVQAIDRAARSRDWCGRQVSSEQFAAKASRHTVAQWRRKTIVKVTSVGFLTGIPGGLVGGALAALDLAYLFASAGQGCYGIGHILGRDIDRERDLRLILACWCGAASAVSTVAAGKVAVKVFGKAALPTAASLAVKVIAKTSFKAGGKFMSKLAPQLAAKVAGQLAGKAGAVLVPLLGAAVSSGISYWVATTLLDAAESYYANEYVQFDDQTLSAEDLAECVLDGC